jgi:hypothetical protein
MSIEDKSTIYYSKEDMVRFQFEGREACKAAAKRAITISASDPTLSAYEHFSHMIESDPTLRGLECLACPTRVTNRSMVNKALLRYQKELNALKPPLSPREKEIALSQVYASISCCSKVLGILTAKTDMAEAYGAHSVYTSMTTMERPLPNVSSATSNVLNTYISSTGPSRSIPVTSAAVENKRTVELMPNDHQQLHKRHRVA